MVTYLGSTMHQTNVPLKPVQTTTRPDWLLQLSPHLACPGAGSQSAGGLTGIDRLLPAAPHYHPWQQDFASAVRPHGRGRKRNPRCAANSPRMGGHFAPMRHSQEKWSTDLQKVFFFTSKRVRQMSELPACSTIELIFY